MADPRAPGPVPSLLRSSTFRLTALYSLVFVLAALGLGIAIYWAMRAELRYELDQRILAERDALLRESGRRIDGLVAAVEARTLHGSADMFYAVAGRDGASIAGPMLDGVPGPGWGEAHYREEDGHPDGGRALATSLGRGWRLVVGADPESIERLDHHMVPLFASTFGLMGLIGVGGGFFLSAALRRRVGAITGTAEAIIGGDLSRRMTVGSRGDEFDRLSATLNRMLDRIGALLENLRQVSGDIAHDLRTPLSRLRQTLELSASPAASDAALRDAMERAGHHADELLALFTAILDISEIEAGSGLRLRRVDLSALVGDIVDSYVPAAEDSGRTLTRSSAPSLFVDGARELVAQMLVNLLDNAMRHTPPGSRIDVSLRAEAERAVLVVSDNGPGIAPADRTRVFQRFVRLERSRTTPGHGLGLRLVAAIAAAHHATIALDDNNPGVKMMLSFPRSEP